jgi:integrase
MAVPKITLCWYTNTPNGWRYFPAQFESRHGVKQARHGWVKDKGREVEYTQGRYVLRSYSEGRKVYTPVAECNPRDVVIALRRAQNVALGAGDTRNPLIHIKTAAPAYVKDCVQRKKPEAAIQAKKTLDEFVRYCPVAHVRSITREMVLSYHKGLRAKGLTERTIANKHTRVKSFLRFCNVETAFMKGITPAYEEKLPTIYDHAQIEAIIRAADPYMCLVIEMALMLGLREQELMFAAWEDVESNNPVFRVRGKPRLGFAVKDKAQREIPINNELLTHLTEWHQTRPKSYLILGTTSDKPNKHLLRTLKRLAKRTNLNCNKCEGCQGKLGECQDWTLHCFRRTYITTLLRGGVDLKTCQHYAGHSTIESTMRYLRPASTSESQAKINAIVWY